MDRMIKKARDDQRIIATYRCDPKGGGL